MSRSRSATDRRDSAVRVLLRDRLLVATVLLFAVFSVWLLLAAGSPIRQVQAYWLVQPVLDGALSYSAWCLARVQGTFRATRRFWYCLAFTAGGFAVGDAAHAVVTLVDPALGRFSPGAVLSLCYAAGGLLAMLTLLAHPDGAGVGRERARYLLDAACVLAGTTSLTWAFVVAPNLRSDPVHDAILLAQAGIVVVCAFALAKMLLGPHPVMSRGAGILFVVALIGWGSMSSSGDTPAPSRFGSQIVLILLPQVVFMVSWRWELARARQRAVDDVGRPSSRTSSALPYVTLGATFALLVFSLPRPIPLAATGALAGAVAITGMVIARQLMAFADNDRLVAALDASLVQAHELQAQLRYQAMHDPLTRLANRTLFAERLDEALAVPTGGVAPMVTVILIDLDGFKEVNDTHGHHVGDALLVAVAEALRMTFRVEDTVARLGGDEFAIVFPGSEVQASARSTDLLHTLLVPVTVDGHALVVRASLGLASGVGLDGDALLRQADAAMYRAKSEGRRSSPNIPEDAATGRMPVR